MKLNSMSLFEIIVACCAFQSILRDLIDMMVCEAFFDISLIRLCPKYQSVRNQPHLPRNDTNYGDAVPYERIIHY